MVLRTPHTSLRGCLEGLRHDGVDFPSEPGSRRATTGGGGWSVKESDIFVPLYYNDGTVCIESSHVQRPSRHCPGAIEGMTIPQPNRDFGIREL